MGVVRVTDRGQLVLVAAAIAALALVPVVAAYLQFGYAPAVADVDADHGAHVSRTLDRLADDAAEDATGADWGEREAAVDQMWEALDPRLRTLGRARLGQGVAVNVTENSSIAGRIACPSGDGRAFGTCDTFGGVVVQERAGETVVVGVAFDVRITTPAGTTRFTQVTRPN